MITPADQSSVSFDPSNAVPAIPGAGGALAAAQIHRPPTVLFTLSVRCDCGARVCGCQYWFFKDTLYVRGVCIDCGEQDFIFAPPRPTPEGVEQHLELVRKDALEMVVEQQAREIAELRASLDAANVGRDFAHSEDVQQLR